MEIKEFKRIRAILPTEVKEISLSVKEGKIASIGEPKNDKNDAETLYLAPGFIDEHIHGANGSDTMDATLEALGNIATSLPQEGVTSFLATTMTMPKENIEKALLNIKEYRSKEREGARVIGCHLEGPFISPLHPGAQDPKAILKPDVTLFDKWNALSGNAIREVTIAYEEGGKDLLAYCVKHGITCSLGHSDCKSALVKEAVQNGLHSITHLFNAQRGFNHREPGIVGEAFLIDGLKTELIADLIHSSKDAVSLVFKNKKKEDIVLITDSTEGKFLKPGFYELGGQKVKIFDGVARLMNDTIAGSILSLNKALSNVKPLVKGYSLSELINLASLNPAKNLGIEKDYGSIEVGKMADFVLLDENFNVYMTIIGGKVAYVKEGFSL